MHRGGMAMKGGRTLLGQLLIVLVAIGLGTALFVYRDRPQPVVWSVGREVTAKISLLTSDRFDLDCVYPEPLPVGSCGFRTPVERSPTELAPKLKPYVTLSREMVLLPDLFERPAIHEHFKKVHRDGRSRKELKRFTVTCRLEVVARSEDIRVRFRTTDAWSKKRAVWVARIKNCALGDQPPQEVEVDP